MHKVVFGILVAAIVWLGYQSWRLSAANELLAGQVAMENSRANKAEIKLAAAQADILASEASADKCQPN